MPADEAQNTWVVIATNGVKVRDQPALQGERVGVLPEGSTFVQMGKLVEADGFEWAPHDFQGQRAFSATRPLDGEPFAVLETAPLPALDVRGVHIDVRHPLGKPSVDELGNIHWIRLNYDVSFEQGQTDLEAAFELYHPICRHYLEAGKRLVFVLTHETFGENTKGLPVVRPLEFASFVTEIVQQWSAFGQQIVWEIWNEPDLGFQNPHFKPDAPHASVPLTPAAFADLLTQTVRKIRAVDPDATVISGGLMAGNPNYLDEMLMHLPDDVRLDGIGIHPYGQDPDGDPVFGLHGNLVSLMAGYKARARRIPLYITEWGVLDQPDASVEEVAKYAGRFLRKSAGLAACAIWYGWADGMHNGYGLVDKAQTRKTALYDVFAK